VRVRIRVNAAPSASCCDRVVAKLTPYLRGGDGEHSELLVMLMLAVMICLLGSGLVYLGERVHAPEQTRMIDTGPPDPPLRIE
jgi:hypothetical protein